MLVGPAISPSMQKSQKSVILTLTLVFLGAAGCSASLAQAPGPHGPTGPATPGSGQAGRRYHDKIDDAVAEGRLTPGQGLIYKLQLLEGAPGVPAEFKDVLSDGKLLDRGSLGFLREALEAFPQMTASEQEQALPLLMPSAYRPAKLIGPSGFKNVTRAPLDIPAPLPAINWTYVDGITANIRVWYAKDNADQAEMAALVKTILTEEIITKEQNLLQKQVLSDGVGTFFRTDARGNKVIWGNGGDGKYDVYLTPLAADLYASAAPYPVDPGAQYGCVARPSYLKVNTARDWKGNVNMLRGALAHEFFHALQFSFDRKEECAAYDPIDEGTATWAEDYVFPKGNTEHEYYRFFEAGDMSLIGATYGTWTFFYFMTQNHGVDKIRELQYGMITQGPYVALNGVLPGGFKKQWPEFVKAGWNHFPLPEDSFLEWDDYDWVPGRGAPDARGHLPPIDTESVVLNASGSYRFKMPLDLAPLTRAYYRFEFTSDQNVHSVSLENPLYFMRDRGAFRVIVKYAKSPKWQVEDWITGGPGGPDTGMEDREICMDKKGERIEEVVVMYSNYRHETDAPTLQAEPSMKATNLGCHQYAGKGKTRIAFKETDFNGTIDVDYKDLVFREAGRNDDGMFRGQFYLESGTASYTYSGTVGGCTGQKSGTFALKTGPSGSRAMGLYPYHVDQPNARSYSFLAAGQLPYVLITHQCPAPKPPAQVPVMLGGFLNSGQAWGNQSALSDGSLQGSAVEGITTVITKDWDFKPKAE